MRELMTSVLLLWAGTTTIAGAQADQPALDGGSVDEQPGETRSEKRQVFGDPWKAYDAGVWDQALQGFVDRQVESPEDPALALSVGSAHFQMQNFEEAEREFATAGLSGEPELRQNALYNMGNSAYRQGRLEESVELFKAALELDPEDEDAKFNLEFVRDEIRRRHEEAQKRQQEQQQNPQQQQGDSQDQDEQQQDEQQQQQQENQQQEPQGADGDADGLPDQVEQSGENPTDPRNPDSDGDGLPDGAEDLDRDGSLDEGETDPNNPDSDGDGIPDAQDTADESSGQPPEQQAGEAGQELVDLEGLTEEEAERYLQALEEGQPVRKHPSKGRTRRPEKDW